MNTVKARPLKPYEGDQLQHMKRQRSNQVNHRHARIVLLSRGGLSNAAIAQHCDCTPTWVRQILHRFNAGGLEAITWYPYYCSSSNPRKFMAEVVEHFRGHPGLSAWDVWNEPEQSFQARVPDLRTLTCYCPHCRQGFLRWLRGKYGDLERLNAVWGRCYSAWEQVELPCTGGALTDFVDWREFHLDTMTEEARWRPLAPEHAAGRLHIPR